MNTMKKILNFLAFILIAFTSAAQTDGIVPNRLLINSLTGETKGYCIDYLDDISFARVEGEVLANVRIKEITTSYLTLSIVRTLECKTYKLLIVPATVAKQLDDDLKVIAYINALGSDVYFLNTDFQDFVLPTYLAHESEYTLFTVGQDEYGTDAGVVRVPFVTPSPEIAGNPYVDAKVTATGVDYFTIAFTPNDDVQYYWILAGEKGSIQEQYEANAPLLGLANFSSMISTFGILCKGDFEYTWKNLDPNTDYEVFISITDVNGSFAPFEMLPTSTLYIGGSGDAYVDINLESFTIADWGGYVAPTLSVSYAPNDQACGYRVALFKQSDYDSNPDGFDQSLCSDPAIPTSNWYFYTADTCDYVIEPATDMVVIAAAKNADGVWGNINKLRFTTPSSIEDYESQPEGKLKIARKDNAPVPATFAKGIIPKTSILMPRIIVGR